MRKVRAPKAVIFDCGGVLVKKYNDKRIKNRDLSQVLLQAGGPKLKTDAFTGKISSGEMWKLIMASGHFSASRTKLIRRELLDGRPADKKTLRLASVISKKYKTAIISDGVKEIFRHWVKKFKLNKYFSVIVLSADVKMSKPRPSIFRLTLKRLNVVPSEALFIDDRFENVKGARKIGIRSFHYTGRNFGALAAWLSRQGVL